MEWGTAVQQCGETCNPKQAEPRPKHAEQPLCHAHLVFAAAPLAAPLPVCCAVCRCGAAPTGLWCGGRVQERHFCKHSRSLCRRTDAAAGVRHAAASAGCGTAGTVLCCSLHAAALQLNCTVFRPTHGWRLRAVAAGAGAAPAPQPTCGAGHGMGRAISRDQRLQSAYQGISFAVASMHHTRPLPQPLFLPALSSLLPGEAASSSSAASPFCMGQRRTSAP